VVKPRWNLDQKITNGGDEVAKVTEILSYDQTREVAKIHLVFIWKSNQTEANRRDHVACKSLAVGSRDTRFKTHIL
jgi:hypothetical protein